ncbi:MAG TPA: hypothetical protein VKX29_06920 [Brumimicrobium sp.]|nr:hypothetical protein [Brumimicrobium sp.]
MKFILQILLVSFSFLSYAQEITVNDINPYQEIEGVIIYIGEGTFEKSSNNTQHVRYFFKFQNTTSKDILLKFNKELYYDGVCYKCESNSDEQQYSVLVKANSIASYEEHPYDKVYSIFVKDNNNLIKKKLTDFKLKNIKISKAR